MRRGLIASGLDWPNGCWDNMECHNSCFVERESCMSGETEDLHSPDNFAFKYPLWAIAVQKEYLKGNDADLYLYSQKYLLDDEFSLVLFTDRDLAERYLSDSSPHRIPKVIVPVPDAVSLLKLFDLFISHGAVNIAFDMPYKDSHLNERGLVYFAKEFRDKFFEQNIKH